MIPSVVTLARWLGPWSSEARSPVVATSDEHVGDLRVRVYRSDGRPRSTYLIAPGLHFAGPDDPRMDRFCRILAAAGHLVLAPFIPSYLALVPDAKAKADFARIFDARARWTTRAPVVFSISFGSLLLFALAAEREREIAGLVVFGGYHDLRAALRFCLTGEIEGGRRAARDPLNQPVVLMNLVDHLDPASRPSPADREALVAAWRRFAERTWGRPEMKVDGRFLAVAEEIAPSVPATARDLFLIGVGARPGAAALAEDALRRFDASALDPSPYLGRITCPVDLVHGADDDVIPFEQSHALAAALTRARPRVHVTGLYGHTGAGRPRASTLARELFTLARVLGVLSR